MPVPTTTALTDAAYDTAIMPAQFVPETTLDAEEAHIADWLCTCCEADVLVVGMSAMPLFARVGLPGGCRVTGLASERTWFARCLPSMHYMLDRPLAVDDRIVTVSGINPVVDAYVYVIDRCRRADVSQRMLRAALTQSLPSYEHIAVQTAQSKRYGDTTMLAIQETVGQELVAPPTLAKLAVQATMSERSLACHFTAVTGSSLRRYMVTLYLELTAFLLRTGRQPFDHIAGECGYDSVSTLGRAFSASYDCGPLQYRAQYHAH